MTQDNNAPAVITNELVLAAAGILSTSEIESMAAYMANDGLPLAPNTVARFYELFLNGSDCKDIHRLNKTFPYQAILMARVKYKWDTQRDEYAMQLQQTIREKVIRAQLETTGLMSDLLIAAKKQHGDKIKRFIQSGDEAELKGALNIESLHSLLKIIEGLQKITGQDKVTKTVNTQNLNVNVTGNNPANPNSKLSPEDAAKILSILAESKRNNGNQPT